MLFNSFQFLFFFPIVTAIYFALPYLKRWIWLLLASCVFYMALIPAYIFILFLLIFIDYWAAIWIERSEGVRRKQFLILSILSTCSVLFIFKYFNFFNSQFIAIFQFFHWQYPVKYLDIILPVGLSFHTFQSLSYVIEVYRSRQKVERNFGMYALYVMFYPQLVAGPIERPQHLLPQFYEEHHFDCDRVVSGLRMMLWGMFKKVVVADTLAIFVDYVYQNPMSQTSVSLIIATVFFAFQIYYDFSGYSHIAIGAARVMGFDLVQNFDRPFASTSIRELWRRWHISLSNWLRDYVFNSLGGYRRGFWFVNIMITFVLCGLWHGANWTFIIWGAMNGFYIIFGHQTRHLRATFIKMIGLNRFPVFYRSLQQVTTFGLFCLALIFFRARNITDAFAIFNLIIQGVRSGSISFQNSAIFHYDPNKFLLVVGLIAGVELLELFWCKLKWEEIFQYKPIFFRWLVYYFLIGIIFWYGSWGTTRKFIYYQF